MKTRSFAACLLAGAMSVAVIAIPAAHAAEKGAAAKAAAPAKAGAYKAPRNFYGQPDLEGYWSNASLTTLERDAKYGARLNLTPEETKQLEGAEATIRDAGNAPTNPKFTIKDLPVDCGRGFSGTNCGYNSGWIDPGETIMRVAGQPRTSFITTTPNGRMPATKTGAAVAGRGGGGGLRPGMSQNDNPETRSMGERCLLSFGSSAGPVMLPLLYNNTYKFMQNRDEVAIEVEMVHDVRHVRLNSQHRTDGVRPYFGDSIGHYEGDTLVVETTNFPRNQGFRGSWENLKVTEKFTRTSAGRVLYQFTVADPTMWDTAWGGEYEFGQAKGQVYEYACHEGNYALEGILAGARAEEATAAAKTASAAPAGGAR